MRQKASSALALERPEKRLHTFACFFVLLRPGGLQLYGSPTDNGERALVVRERGERGWRASVQRAEEQCRLARLGVRILLQQAIHLGF